MNTEAPQVVPLPAELPRDFAGTTAILQQKYAECRDTRLTPAQRRQSCADYDRIGKHHIAMQNCPPAPVIQADEVAAPAIHRRAAAAGRQSKIEALELIAQMSAEEAEPILPASPDKQLEQIIASPDVLAVLKRATPPWASYSARWHKMHSELFPAEAAEELRHKLATAGGTDERSSILQQLAALESSNAPERQRLAAAELLRAFEELEMAVFLALGRAEAAVETFKARDTALEKAFFELAGMERHETAVSRRWENMSRRIQDLRFQPHQPPTPGMPPIPHPESTPLTGFFNLRLPV
jgi:hypothetical protein